MSKNVESLELINGYANNFITDIECNDMMDLLDNHISVIKDREPTDEEWELEAEAKCWDNEYNEMGRS
jgi:hypothetical protein